MSFATKLGLVSFVVFCSIPQLATCEDLPCLARDVGIEGRSIVCVCNAEYCDTITREVPEPGTYVVYTSTNDGQRFNKSFGVIQTQDSNVELETDEDDEDPDAEILEDIRSAALRLFTNRRYQFIEGFGGSVTDAAAINWRKLSDAAQMKFIDSYFSSEGLEYNLIRVPIGGADFSTHPYTYNMEPRHDAQLSNYSLTEEDLFFKLPMIKRSQRAATAEIKITASTWSPPTWMKTNDRITGFGQLRPEYYQTYADYHLKFIEEYSHAEVPIWAITTTNEPINGVIPLVDFNSMGWYPTQLAHWIYNNLGPTIRNSRFNQTLILAIDDQRYMLPVYLAGMISAEPRAFDYIDGFAIHYYGNFAPTFILSRIQNRYPNKILLSTEACEGGKFKSAKGVAKGRDVKVHSSSFYYWPGTGPMPWDRFKVEIGSWRRGTRYVNSILEDLNNYVVGWIDWNLCLDPEGGPNWADNFVDAPILVYGDQDEFIKQPMFYAMGHFSKFIPRGSRRIQASRRSLLRVQNLAVLTPEGNIVMVLQNARDNEINVRVRINSQLFIGIHMEAQSLKTVEIAL